MTEKGHGRDDKGNVFMLRSAPSPMKRIDTVRWLKFVTLAGIYGGLLMPLMFIPIVIFPFVFSKLVFFQVLIGLTFPAYLALAWMEPQYRPKSHPLYIAIGAYFIALTLSVVFAADPSRAWWGNQERMNGLFTLVHLFLWLTMAVSVLKTWDQWRRLLNFEVFLSAVMALVAMMQKVNPDLLLFRAGPRVGGLLDNPIYMAAYQIFNLSFLTLLAFRTRSKVAWAWYGVFAAFDITAFILAQSRGALVGLAVGLIAFVSFYAFFTENKKARLGILSFVALLFVAYGMIFAFRDTAFIRDSSFGRLTNFSGTTATRLIAWDIAWHGFLERPLTGWGLDNFHILFNLRYNPYSLRYGNYETWFDRSHNTVLDVLSMTGIFGFVTFFAIFGALFYCVWRAYRRGWIDLPIASILFALPIAYFVQNLFVFDHPAAFSMSFLLYALVIAASRPGFIGQMDPAATTENGQRSFPMVAFVLLQLAVILLVWRTSILPFQASRLSIQANNTFNSENPDITLGKIKKASSIWTPYLDEQAFLVSRNLIMVTSQGQLQKLPKWEEFYAVAKDLLDREIVRHPQNTNMLMTAARFSQEMGQYKPEEIGVAEQRYKAGITSSPKRQQVIQGLARLYLQTGRTEEALALFNKIKDFDLELGEGHWYYGISLYYDKQNLQEGAQEIALSQSVQYPYQLSDPAQIVPLSDAYLTLKDNEKLRGLYDIIVQLPKGQVQSYAQLAYKYELAGMIDMRDKTLTFGETYYPTIKSDYQQQLSLLKAAEKERIAPQPQTLSAPKSGSKK